MSKVSLRHFRGYRSDNRLSMDIYADSISAIVDLNEFDFEVFKPESSLEKYSRSRLLMRYLRYWHYPNMVTKEAKADLNHILDHGYAHLLPSISNNHNDTRSCITVHDLIPMLTWNGQIKSIQNTPIPFRKPWLNLRSLTYLKSYDRIIAVSLNTKNDLVEHLKIKENKIDVIPPVISSIFQKKSAKDVDEFAQKYNFDRKKKWIMISGGEFYKNHEVSLDVISHLNRYQEEEFCLIKTGHSNEKFNAMVAKLGLASKVRSVFLKDSNELPLLYGMVDCLLFPSLYEGFGMPVAEALACGTPVVTSNRGALPEVVGTIGEIRDAGDVNSLSDAVKDSVLDENRRRRVSNDGPVWVDKFRANNVKSMLIDSYRKLNNQWSDE